MATKAKTHWQKQESRPVRPFRSAKDFLDDVGFRMYADEDFKKDEAMQTGNVELSKLALAVRIPSGVLNFEEVVGVPTDLLRLVVTIEDRTFKDSEVAVNTPMSEVGANVRVLELDAEAVERLSWAGETRVHVAVVLAEARNGGEVGTAQRVGAWVVCVRQTHVDRRWRSWLPISLQRQEWAASDAAAAPRCDWPCALAAD